MFYTLIEPPLAADSTPPTPKVLPIWRTGCIGTRFVVVFYLYTTAVCRTVEPIPRLEPRLLHAGVALPEHNAQDHRESSAFSLQTTTAIRIADERLQPNQASDPSSILNVQVASRPMSNVNWYE